MVEMRGERFALWQTSGRKQLWAHFDQSVRSCAQYRKYDDNGTSDNFSTGFMMTFKEAWLPSESFSTFKTGAFRYFFGKRIENDFDFNHQKRCLERRPFQE